MSLIHKCHFDVLLLNLANSIQYSTVSDHRIYNETQASVMCIPAYAYCNVHSYWCCVVVCACQSAHSWIISRDLSLCLSHVVVFSCFLFFLHACPSQTFPSPRSILRFNPYLQFSPPATLSANLHHTTHRQWEGEMKSGMEEWREG